MNCPHCASSATKERTKKTSLGYRTFCCESVQTHFHRAYRNPLQLPGISYRCYPARRVVAAAVQIESARVFLKCLWNEALSSPMRPFETLKRALHSSWQINCEPSDEVKQDGRGTLMRPTSTSKGNGVISLGPSIGMGTWWTRW
jgi:hypothetical protein